FIFGAICPTCGTGAAVVMLRCDTVAMQWHLNEIATQVAPSAHAVVLLDQAGWHTTDKLDLPPRSPEFNPFENV
ncbi:MAG: IS630 family transposase, partial [Alphaproteobacteria bacterium]|nr:IS630 family transposase [Alphaproteobacteria bacterium]